MKIKNIEAKKVELELIQPIKIALGSINHTETVLVKIESEEGLTGYGEGSGIPFVTGETPDTILKAVEVLKKELLGRDVFGIDTIHKTMDKTLCFNTSAKAAIDIALYDIMSKASGLPLYRFLGGLSEQIETDMTIGISSPEEMVKEALLLIKKGFRHIKVKAGIDPEKDLEAVKLIKEVAGKEIHVKVDANQGWTAKEAIGIIEKMAGYGVEVVEQPCAGWDMESLSFIRSRTSVKIMADESCFSPLEALKLIKKEAVDLINIKLMKCGGLYPAMQINAIAEAAGVSCMLGCMMESRLGIAAGAALVASRDNIIYGDLDSFMYLKDSSQIKGGFTHEGPYITLNGEAGLGIEVDF